MRRRYTYIVWCLLAIMALNGCGKRKAKTNWTVSLQKGDKNPYGSYLAYESLKYYFPGASTEFKSKWFRYNNIDDKMKYDNTSLFILNGLNLYLSDSELKRLLEYAAAGNEVLIFASNIDDKLQQKLHFNKVAYRTAYEETPLGDYNDGSENASVLHLENEPTKRYGYYGRYIKGYFLIPDDSSQVADTSEAEDDHIKISSQPEVLGKMNQQANFIRCKVGEGHITLHSAPLVLSNYFLLQPGNKEYLAAIWQSLPGDIKHIYWNEYFKRTADKSDFDVLWRYPATRYALILAIVGLLMYILFEGKRRQGILPVIPPLENSSVSFVETVGRLYYNKGDHSNLAEKMIQHFLEWVRTHYFLNTNHLNEEFTRQLMNKSGKDEAMVQNLMDMIHEIRNGYKTDEAYLYQLYNSIEQFYKTKPNGSNNS